MAFRRALWIAPVLLFSLAPGPLAASESAAESVRYVVAEAGLQLRARPKIETESLAVIPFGAEVRVVGQAATEEGLVVENVPGQWIRVSYEGQRGYAFSGHLIHYPPPTGQSLGSYARKLERDGFTVERTTTDHAGSPDHHPGTEVELVLERADMAEAFLIARRLFAIPASLPYPGPGMSGEQTYDDPDPPKTLWFRNLVAIRDEDGELRELRYYVRGEAAGISHFIRRRAVGTTLLEYEFAD